jgi:small GTP-binding protein
MSTITDKIKQIEHEMSITQKNKANEMHLGLLKSRLSKLRRELITPSTVGKGGDSFEGFEVKKSGDVSIGMIGFPSVGKSTLFSELTGAESLAAAYEFTTLTCIPGTFTYKGCKVQLLDLPGIIEGAKDGKGRGRQVIAVARRCNLILLCLDASKPMTHKKVLEHELSGMGIRLNQTKPDIVFAKKEKGGVQLTATVKLSHLDNRLVTGILKEYRINNADVTIRCDATVDQLIDVIEGNRVYMPCIYVLNKIDSITMEELELLAKVPHYVPISSSKKWNLEELKEKIWQYLGMTRIYTKPKGAMPNYDEPMVLPHNNRSIETLCNRIHKTFLAQFAFAKVWGTSVKYPGQQVGKEHILDDEDVVSLIKKK